MRLYIDTQNPAAEKKQVIERDLRNWNLNTIYFTFHYVIVYV